MRIFLLTSTVRPLPEGRDSSTLHFLDYNEVEKYSSKKVEEYENEGYDVINLIEEELN